MLLLPATLTSREATATLRMLKQAMQSEGGDGPVVVDAGPLGHLDSSALAVLLEVDRLAAAFGRGFAVRSAPSKLAALAHLYGVDALLLEPEAAAASAAVATPAVVDQRRPAA